MAFKDMFSFLFQRSTSEERVAEYVIREHDRGRTLHDILEDKYVVNRLPSQEQRDRLLDRPEVIHAIGGDTVAAAEASASTPPDPQRGNGPRGRAVSVNQGEDGILHHRPVGPVPRPPFGGFAARGLEGVALLLERVGVVVVPVALPEAGTVLRRQLDPAQPLRALPEVLPGHDQA